MKLHNLTYDEGHHLTRHMYGGLPASYLFVETIVGARILGEAAANRFSTAIQAAMGRLQNFMTPGASTDLEAMLGFFAPQGGGLNKVREMVTKAGALEKPVTDDKIWWQELFTVFNLQDPGIQDQITQKTLQSAGGIPGAQPQQAAQPQPVQQPTQPEQESPDIAALNANMAQQQASVNRIGDLQAQMSALKGQGQVPTEAVFNCLANILLNEADVKSNLKFVASNLMRRLGYASTTSVQEVNWLKKFVNGFNRPVAEGRFGDFFRNLRMMAANPGHLQAKAQNSHLKSYNERVAKVAIQHLSDWLTGELNSRLQVANLTTKDMITANHEWQKMQNIAKQVMSSGGTLNPAMKAKVKAAHDNLSRVVFALNPELATGGVE